MTVTDADGSFKLTGLTPGEQWLTVYTPDHRQIAARQKVQTGDRDALIQVTLPLAGDAK
jgi:hypothetical protein